MTRITAPIVVAVWRTATRGGITAFMIMLMTVTATTLAQPATPPPAPSAPEPPSGTPATPEAPAAPPPNALEPAPPPRSPPPAPAVVRAEQLAPAELTGLLGHAVVDAEGAQLGRIVDLLIDAKGQVRAAVVDVGGFMGVGNRKVAVAWSALRFAPGDKGPAISILIPPARIKSWADYIPGRPVSILGTPGGDP